MNDQYTGSRLERDLAAGSRDALYRAMSYAVRHGGPPIAGAADDRANLEAQRAGVLSWLRAQADPATLVREYEEYCERWSPAFKD